MGFNEFYLAATYCFRNTPPVALLPSLSVLPKPSKLGAKRQRRLDYSVYYNISRREPQVLGSTPKAQKYCGRYRFGRFPLRSLRILSLLKQKCSSSGILAQNRLPSGGLKRYPSDFSYFLCQFFCFKCRLRP